MSGQGWDDVAVEPFRASRGFFAFVGVLILPAFVALVVYFGAWIVADEVHAAANARASADFTSQQEGGDVAGWKKALVGICPAH